MEHNTHFSTSLLINKGMKTILKDKAKTNSPKIKLKKEIESSLKELTEIRQCFEYVDEPELVDYAIYREKAIITKISYLFKKAKKVL